VSDDKYLGSVIFTFLAAHHRNTREEGRTLAIMLARHSIHAMQSKDNYWR
jgi:hypothetical protein